MLSIAGAFAALTAAEYWAGAGASQPVVRFHGCTAVRRIDAQHALSCITKPGSEITLWSEGTPCQDLYLTESGAVLDVPTQMVNGGCQLRFQVGTSRSVTKIEVHAAKADETWLTLQIDRSKPTFLDHKKRMKARALRDLSIQDLQQKLGQTANEEERLDIISALAVSYERQGCFDQALSSYAHQAELSHKSGYSSIETESLVKRSEILWRSGRIYTKEARSYLNMASSSMQPEDVGAFLLRERLHALLPDVDNAQALESFRRQYTLAIALRNTAMLRLVASAFVNTLIDTKNLNEAQAVLLSFPLLLDGADACEKAQLLRDQAWSTMTIIEYQGIVSRKLFSGNQMIEEILKQAHSYGTLCDDNILLLQIYRAIARAALLERRLSDVKRAVDAARSVVGLPPTSFIRMSLLDYEAQWTLASGNAQEALSLFRELATRSEQSQETDKGFFCSASVGQLESIRSIDPRADVRTLTVAIEKCLARLKEVNPPLYNMLSRRM